MQPIDMTIKLQEKSTYGKVRFYPANPLAYKFLILMDQKSFTLEDIPKLQNLGLNVQIAPPEPSIITTGLPAYTDPNKPAQGDFALRPLEGDSGSDPTSNEK